VARRCGKVAGSELNISMLNMKFILHGNVRHRPKIFKIFDFGNAGVVKSFL
jgi:hypothetical protein